MKTHNVLWSIIIVICIVIPLMASIYWEKQCHIIEAQLVESHNTHISELHKLDQKCDGLLDDIKILDEQLIAKSNLLNEVQEKLEQANILIDAYKSEKYFVSYIVTEQEIEMIAQTIWGEARGLNTYEQSLVIWCILNRVDDGTWGNTVAEVVTAKSQFHGYSNSHPITDEHKALARDVVTRWQMEKYCQGNVGRTLPQEYLYFHSEHGHNVFTSNYRRPYNTYDYSSGFNPYS